jgi:arylsulfatase A-like enzyme
VAAQEVTKPNIVYIVVDDMGWKDAGFQGSDIATGAKLGKNKPLDGVDVGSAIRDGKPSPRNEIVYNVDPMAGAVRQGDWKLVWKASLPQKLELFNLAEDKSETTNLAGQNPEKVRERQARIAELAGQMVPPLLLMEAVRLTFFSPLVTPDPSEMFNAGD